MADKKPKKPKGPTVKVGGKIGDGNGGYFAKGDTLPAGCDEAGLRAKGLID